MPTKNPPTHFHGLNTISPREFEIIRLLAANRTSQQVAAELGLSIKTVDTHRFNLKTKLKMSDGSLGAFIIFAQTHGLVSPPSPVPALRGLHGLSVENQRCRLNTYFCEQQLHARGIKVEAVKSLEPPNPKPHPNMGRRVSISENRVQLGQLSSHQSGFALLVSQQITASERAAGEIERALKRKRRRPVKPHPVETFWGRYDRVRIDLRHDANRTHAWEVQIPQANVWVTGEVNERPLGPIIARALKQAKQRKSACTAIRVGD